MPYFLQSTPAKYHKLPPSAEEAAAQCFCLFTAVLQSCPCASSIINEASCLCKYTSSAEIGGWRAIKQICQGTAAPSQALQFVTLFCAESGPRAAQCFLQSVATLSPRHCCSCLLMTYFKIHAASLAGTGLSVQQDYTSQFWL